MTFDAEKVPEKPNEAAKEQLENFGVEQKFIEKVPILYTVLYKPHFGKSFSRSSILLGVKNYQINGFF